MHDGNVTNIDLNLLKPLQALLTTASVTKAADAINLSQPAMSRALDRLRYVLKDPLLVRSGRGMVLTPRAEELKEPVKDALAHVAQVLAPSVFDPGDATQEFRIMAPDYVAQLIMPELFARLSDIAPNVKLTLENLSDETLTDLQKGKIDLGFGVVDDGPMLENVASQALFEDRQVCLMRKGHPLVQSRFGIKEYAEASHALLSITGRGNGRIDDVLADHGLSRAITLRVSNFLTIGSFIESSDLIITVPAKLADQIMTPHLVTRPLPRKLQTPGFTVSQIWHERFTKDPAHQWLRRMVKQVVSS